MHFLALAAGAVDDGDGLAARRRGDDLDRELARFSGGVCAGRAVMAGVLHAVAGAFGLAGAAASAACCDHRDRLAAQRIVGENRPAHHGEPEQAEHAGERLAARATGSFDSFLRLSWPSGAFRSSGATAQILANHLQRNRTSHVRQFRGVEHRQRPGRRRCGGAGTCPRKRG